MPNVTVTCDRCKRRVDGYYQRGRDGVSGATGGYYETSQAEPWGRFANPGEEVVCDECMLADPRYIAAYGDRRPVKEA